MASNHSNKIIAFHSSLGRWYATHGRRNLPWRTAGDPYPIYISEVMLQQTQVKTVLERFYFPFLECFPTLESLASAEEESVLKAWQGLGYYSRARNLHKAAQLTTPALPDDLEGLLALPGIGKNTANAILAFGFRKPYAVMEANVKRVICRMFALKNPTTQELWEHAEALLNQNDPFDYNQAMMDVGAMICSPKAPMCGECPAYKICKGKNEPSAYPAAKLSKITPVRHKRIIILQDANQRVFLAPRDERFLGGLYGFLEQDELQKQIEWQGKKWALNAKNQIGTLTQTYSHFRLQAKVHLIQLTTAQNGKEWFTRDQINALPLSKADEKATGILLSFYNTL